MIHSERVIASTEMLPPIVNEALDLLPDDALLLDVGAGNGRLSNILAGIRPDVQVVGVEYDASLALTTDGPARKQLVVGDARNMPFASDAFDTVTAVNTLHEVVNASEAAERATQLEATIVGLGRILKPGGLLLIHDGVMPVTADEPLVISPNDQKASQLFTRFGEEYTARPALVQSLDAEDMLFSTDMATVVTFLTKLNYLLDGSAWEGERQQLYPFTDLDSIICAMAAGGIVVESVSFPEASTRNGLRKLLANYAITRASDGQDYTVATFPACQVLLKGRKI